MTTTPRPLSARTQRAIHETVTEWQYAAARGARNRQTFYWRVRNARTRWLEKHTPAGVWHIALGHPGGAYADTGHEPTPPAHHTPTVLTHTDDAGRDRYRGACLACTWEDAERTGRRALDTAIEDAHDHSHPGWRTLPVHPADPDQARRARNHLAALYPPGWIATGAPILQPLPHRQHQLPTRHTPRYRLHTPAPRTTNRPRPEAAAATLTLF